MGIANRIGQFLQYYVVYALGVLVEIAIGNTGFQSYVICAAYLFHISVY